MGDPSAVGIMEGAYFVSKRELLDWLRTEFNISINRIDDCGTGAVYLQILDKMFPDKVPMKRVKLKAKQEWECLHNLKILQSVFLDCGIKKFINIEKLSKCNYLDNLEFLQWMKCYYDKKAMTNPELKSLPRTGQRLTSKSSERPSQAVGQPLPSPTRITSSSNLISSRETHRLKELLDESKFNSRPYSIILLEEKEIAALREEIHQIETESRFYFGNISMQHPTVFFFY